jgi:hypothetical protein
LTLAGCDGDDTSHLVIISIGDSVASGEGNPDGLRIDGRPRWEDRQCHLSVLAGQTLAATNAQRSNSELGFRSFACSGATIEKGLLHHYWGVDHRFDLPKPAQLDQLTRLKAGRDFEVAALLLSIGANDIGFSKIVEFCALVDDCPNQHFNPHFILFPAGEKYPLLRDYVDAKLTALRNEYRLLAEQLVPLLSPDRVVITEYFDPTTGDGGRGCTMLFGGVLPDESTWAREHVLRGLNAEIDRTTAYGWKVVTRVPEEFRGHGLCASHERWVHTLDEGLTGQALPLFRGRFDLPFIQDVVASTKATLHPNVAGHRQIAALIAPVLNDVLEQ